jgi:AcrR family transcriptional regulator
MPDSIPPQRTAEPAKRNFVKGQATRAALMHAARVVFAREGFMNAEVSQITEQAGKAKGTFYLYFDSKTHLLTAMIEAFAEDLRRPEGLAEPIHPPEQIQQVIGAIWNTYKRHAATFRALADAATKHPEFADMYRDMRSHAERDFTAMIQARQQAGHCLQLDCRFAAEALETMVCNCIYRWLTLHDSIQGEQDEARALQTLVAIMQAALEVPAAL